MSGIVGNLKTFDDYRRAEEEFQLRKQKAMQSQQGMPPAALQLANEYQKARAAGDTQRMHDIEQFSKIVDRGVLSSPDGGYTSAPGYDQLLAQRKALISGADESAKQIQKNMYEPAREADIANRKANITISSAAELEKQKKIGAGDITDAEKKATGKNQLTTMINSLRDEYNKLNELEAIPSSKYSAGKNLEISLRASDIGQTLGRIAGTKEQVIRGNIKNAIPRLMSSISNASGMSAKQMDSIPEMKLLKESVSDPKQPIETVLKTLDDLVSLYGNLPDRPTLNTISPKDPRIEAARKAGYSEQEIINYLGSK